MSRPDGGPDVAAVLDGGRRRVRTRRLVAGGSALAVAGLVVGAVLVAHDPAPAEPAPRAAVAVVALPSRTTWDCGFPGRCEVALEGDAAAPTVVVAEPDRFGRTVPTRLSPAESATVDGSLVRAYRSGATTALLVPLGEDEAAQLDLAKGVEGRGAFRLRLGGKAYEVVRVQGAQTTDTPVAAGEVRHVVTAVWRARPDGTWTGPGGERPRVARFPSGETVSWFPTARRVFLSVGRGALGLARGGGAEGDSAAAALAHVLTDGPHDVYQVLVLPADAHDVEAPGGPVDQQQLSVDGGVVVLQRQPLPDGSDGYGAVMWPAWTDSTGTHRSDGVPAIGYMRTPWPQVAGAPRVTGPAAPQFPDVPTSAPVGPDGLTVTVSGSPDEPSVVVRSAAGSVTGRRDRSLDRQPDAVLGYRSARAAVLLTRVQPEWGVHTLLVDTALVGEGTHVRLGGAEYLVTVAKPDLAPGDIRAVYHQTGQGWEASDGEQQVTVDGPEVWVSWFPKARVALVTSDVAKQGGREPAVTARTVPTRGSLVVLPNGAFDAVAVLPAGARDVHVQGMPTDAQVVTKEAGAVTFLLAGRPVPGPAPRLGDITWTAADGVRWRLPSTGPASRA